MTKREPIYSPRGVYADSLESIALSLEKVLPIAVSFRDALVRLVGLAEQAAAFEEMDKRGETIEQGAARLRAEREKGIFESTGSADSPPR